MNQDGYEDVILAGGIYNTEVETLRLDAGTGQLLLSDGKGEYLPVTKNNSGLSLSGDVKSKMWLNNNSIDSTENPFHYLIVGVNNDKLKVLQLKEQKPKE